MICSAQNKEFIDKILDMSARGIKAMLKDQDEKYVVRKQRQITKNMPQYLKPNEGIETKSTTFLQNILQVNLINEKDAAQAKLAQFPSTFNEKTKSHHWNMNAKQANNKFGQSGSKGFMQNLMSNFEGFKSGFDGEANLWKGEKLPELKLQINQLQREKVLEVENHLRVQSLIKVEGLDHQGREHQKQIPSKVSQILPQKGRQSGLQADNQSQVTFTHARKNPQQSLIPNPFAPPLLQQQKHSPFISNKTNFLDLHTNKKPTQQNYLTPETYSMNMLQYAHNQKRQNTFGDDYSYPNVIMSGSGTGWMKTAQSMRENPFKKTFITGPKFEGFDEGQIKEQSTMHDQRLNARMQSQVNFRENVQDVLKYTLGDKRYTNSMLDRQNELVTSVNLKSNVLQSSFQKQISKKQRVLENPFVRRPASTYKY